ncbi:hypothetical protein C2845_PM07G10900 [Panicum miliaceum]|uniref:Uncharacterized protein n=1 Tax=Panicum miliaceum TaxID=4540 RepID=A0A3L6SKJ9_PANMI|nr:hypothetical protein C2845_PM07G10900 [Panicum miliaceum]
MAPKAERPKTRSLGKSEVTDAVISDMVRRGYVAEGAARPPPKDEVFAHPQKDKVVARWSIKHWLLEAEWIGGIPSPHFAKTFHLKKNYIDSSAIESWTDEILGAESIGEYKAIMKQLGGTHTKRVFRALGIDALERTASLKHKIAEEKRGAKKDGGAPATVKLEKQK